MELHPLPYDLSVCKIHSIAQIDPDLPLYFIGKTDEELSLVCLTESVPSVAAARDDGWKAFRICGVLDFSLIGILSRITTILAENRIGIFAVSTYHTDYVLVKKDAFDRALEVLREAGYTVN